MKKNFFVLDIIITVLSLFAVYWLHVNSFIDVDVAWHVEGAKRLLAGGNYLLNIFDDNSPFVFAFYFPVVWFYQLTHISYVQLIIIYVLLVNTVFLFVTRHIINQAFSKDKIFYARIMYYIFLFILFFLPASNFGQREMILINFTLPYFLIAIFTAKNPDLKFSKKLVFASAFLAAFGVMQNIIFLLVFILVDLFRLIKLKKLQAYQLVFYCLVVVESLIMLFLYPEYINYIIPLLLCYGPGFNSDSVETVMYPFLVWLSLALIFIRLRKFYKDAAIMMTWIAAFVSLLIYLFEQKIWYYHVYPALVFSLLLLGLVIIAISKEFSVGRKNNSSIFIISFAVAIIITMMRNVVLSGIYEIDQFRNPNSSMRQIVSYATKHFDNKKIFYLIVNDHQGYSLPLYDNSITVSPWFNPWFVPYILQRKESNMGYFCSPKKDERLFVYLIASSIARTTPDFVIINIPKAKIDLQGLSRVFTVENISIFLKDYYIFDSFGKNIVYKRK